MTQEVCRNVRIDHRTTVEGVRETVVWGQREGSDEEHVLVRHHGGFVTAEHAFEEAQKRARIEKAVARVLVADDRERAARSAEAALEEPYMEAHRAREHAESEAKIARRALEVAFRGKDLMYGDTAWAPSWEKAP